MFYNQVKFFVPLMMAVSAYAGTVISTPQDSDRLLLCGKASVARVNARMAADPEGFDLNGAPVNRLFDSSMPSYMPPSYWGIPSDAAYVCLGGNHFNDSTWTLPGYVRNGAYDWFEFHILGFKTDAQGNWIDTNNDGVANEDDWSQVRYMEAFSGRDANDSKLIASAFANTWGSRSAAKNVTLSGYDAAGYPSVVTVTSGSRPYFTARMNQTDMSACPETWEKCIVWGSYAGNYYSLSPNAVLKKENINFAHNENRWVSYNPLIDSYVAADPKLNELLQKIEFVPTFWVQAKDARINFVLP